MNKQKSSLEEVKSQEETPKQTTNNGLVKVAVKVPRLEYGKKTYKEGEVFELDIKEAQRFESKNWIKIK